MTGSGSYPYTQDSSSVIMVFMKSGSLFVESSLSYESWMYGYHLKPIVVMKIRALNTTSLKCLGSQSCRALELIKKLNLWLTTP
jgi:hypothetical protein